MNQRIEKLTKEIEKTKERIAELQKKVESWEQQKTELENEEYVALARSYCLTPSQLAEFLKSNRLPQRKEEPDEN